MKLKELFSKLDEVQKKIGTSTTYCCGGLPRDKFMGRLDNISDIDVTTGDKTINYLAQEFENILKKDFNITRKTMPDGHTSIFIGNMKLDFSSNFNAPNINKILFEKGMESPTELQKEIYSRDFTCNSLLMPLNLKSIIDLTKNGINDIKNKKIKCCLDPSITLMTNRNRVVRAIYLACKLDFDIDDSIIDFVKSNPDSIKVSTERSLIKKLNQSFERDADKASFLLTKMNLWNYIPISKEIYPYYIKVIK